MDKVEIQDQDFALTSNSLRLMQQAWESLEQLSLLGAVGSDANYILSGCEQVGNVVSAGVVVLNGKMLPFAGGAANQYISAAEQSAVITVGAGTYTEKVRFAQWGTGTDQQLWATMRNKKPAPKCHHEIIYLPVDDFVAGDFVVVFNLADFLQGDFTGCEFFDCKVTWKISENDGASYRMVTVENNSKQDVLSGCFYYNYNDNHTFIVANPTNVNFQGGDIVGLILQFSWR